MLIIGHRGAAGQKPENTLEGIRASHESDVDMIEFDVRLTKDKVPVLVHDRHLWRTHNIPNLVRRMTYEELQRRTEHSINPITTLDEVLAEFGGQIILNLELKDRGSAEKILPIVKKYVKKHKDWEIFLFSSYSVRELARIRKESPKAQLGLLQYTNSLRFLFVNRQLELNAVGFHRLNINSFAVGVAKKLGLFTYAYTVNRPEATDRLMRMGVDGIITDLPKKMKKYISKMKLRS